MYGCHLKGWGCGLVVSKRPHLSVRGRGRGRVRVGIRVWCRDRGRGRGRGKGRCGLKGRGTG